MTKRDIARGGAMGLADAVPGVSGGTVALLLGIHPKLVASIAALKPALLATLWAGRKHEHRAAAAVAWREANLTFLLQLGLGILAGLWVGAKTLVGLLEAYPEALAAFFLALILAGLPAVLERTDGRLASLVIMAVAGMFAAALTALAPAASSPAHWTLPFFGALAACAMILPGISGSYSLLIVGVYPVAIAAVAQFDVVVLLLFGTGAVIGLLAFSHVLHGLLSKWPSRVFAAMAGLLVGSLGRLWPWRTEPGFAAGDPAIWDSYTLPGVFLGALLGLVVGRGLLTLAKKA